MEELKELRAGLQRETGHLIRIQRQNRGQDEAAMMQTARLIVKASGKFAHCVDARARKDVILGILSSITFKDKAITGYTLRPGALRASDQQCADGLSIPLDEPIALGPAACPIEARTRKCRKCGETKPASQFYGTLTICSSPRRSSEERTRHLKRLQHRKSAKADSSPVGDEPI